MARFVKGDVVVIQFPFSDFSSSSKRPALVISTLKGDEVILCQITSKSHKDDIYQIGLKKEDFKKGGLKLNSFIKPSILFTLRKSKIIYKIGSLSGEKIRFVEKEIVKIITS